MSQPDPTPPTVHATALRIGAVGVLIRGPSGAGKSSLALALLRQTRLAGGSAALVADDRVALSRRAERLIARPPAVLAGRIELAGRGILDVPHEAEIAIALVLDLVEPATLARMPEPAALSTEIDGLSLPCQPLPTRNLPIALLLAEAALSAVTGTPWPG